MSTASPIVVSPADRATIDTFADQVGIPSGQLISSVLAAFAENLRHTHSLTLPVRIGLPSHQCTICPMSQTPQHSPIELPPPNLIKGWPGANNY